VCTYVYWLLEPEAEGLRPEDLCFIYIVCAFLGEVRSSCDRRRNRKKERLAHREGRTRSLQIMIEVMMRLCTRYKSLTLYPIELGGRLGMNPIGVTRGYRSGRDLHALALVLAGIWLVLAIPANNQVMQVIKTAVEEPQASHDSLIVRGV
jgi:hypothetical protein